MESILGVERVLQCHGSFATASCLQCHNQVDGSVIKDSIFSKQIAYCQICKAKADGPPIKIPGEKKVKRLKKNKNKPWEDEEDPVADNLAPVRPPYIMKPGIAMFKSFLMYGLLTFVIIIKTSRSLENL